MTKKKEATKPVAKKVALKKATKNNKEHIVTLEEYSMEMTIPTGQYANIRPKITVKAYSMDKAHDFMAPHMNKLWKEYYLINERRPEPVKAPIAKVEQNVMNAPSTSPTFVPAPNSTSNALPTQGTTTQGNTTTTEPDKAMNYLKDPKPAKNDTRPLTVDEICEATGGKTVEDMTADEIFPNEPSPASSVAYNKATQAIESCMSFDALEIIRAQVDKSVKLTHEDKNALQPLLLSRFEKLSNGL